MNVNKLFAKYGFHLAAIVAFLIIASVYFKPAFDGYVLKQHDVKQFFGMSREIDDYKQIDGKTPLWTNSMFGGMPSAQIHVDYPGNYFKKGLNLFQQVLNTPVSFLFLYLVGFYVFALCLKINRWVALIGSVAFAFSSYNIIILQAGHLTKANAIALLLPVLGGFIMAYQRNAKWGSIIFGIALSLQLTANHLQITYYSMFLFLGLGIYFLVEAIRQKQLPKFGIATVGIFGAAIIAAMINIGNIKITKDYSTHTTRGGNDITINADGTAIDKSNEDGLDLDYMTNWSYGIGESVTLLSPYVKGGASEVVANSPFAEIVENADIEADAQNFIMNYYSYWGEQPFTSGPVYFGVVVMFLSFLALVLLKSNIKWVYFAVALLTLALSWGKNFLGLTEFFAHSVPGYNKFRAVTIILSITSMIFPILAVLILNQFYTERSVLKQQAKKFYIAAGCFVVLLLALKMIGLNDGYMSGNDQKQFESIFNSRDSQKANMLQQIMTMSDEDLAKNGIDRSNTVQINSIIDAQIEKNFKAYDVNALKEVRQDIYHSSMNRSLIFTILAAGILVLLFVTEIDYRLVIGGLGVLIAIDLIAVDLNYLSNKEDDNGELVFWQKKSDMLYPELATQADLDILASEQAENSALNSSLDQATSKGKNLANELDIDENVGINKVVEYEKFRALNRNTNYRVLDLASNPFNSSRASYFHKSIGGYHGAKLRNIQNLIEFHFSGNINFKVLEMLNTKYIIQQDGNMAKNPTVLGNAWTIREVKTFETPNEEIRALGNSYQIASKNAAQLLVNNVVVKDAIVTGSESMKVVVQNDTFNVIIPQELQRNLNAGLSDNLEAVFVMDVNKKTNFIPKAMLANDSLSSFLQLMDLKVAYNFEPATDVVMLNSEAKNLSSKIYSGVGSVKMTHYHPEKLTYDFNSADKQLVVFSEIYYKDGWKAYVDGKETPIIKANYLLRSVEVPAGKHTIELRYEYPFFKTANLLSGIGCSIFGLLVILGLYQDNKRKRKIKY